jgi:hypothetical protein
MNQDDQDNPMPADVRDLLEREARQGRRRMCLPPAELAGDWKAFEPIGGQDGDGPTAEAQ